LEIKKTVMVIVRCLAAAEDKDMAILKESSVAKRPKTTTVKNRKNSQAECWQRPLGVVN
jgi:hypothetical protein